MKKLVLAFSALLVIAASPQLLADVLEKNFKVDSGGTLKVDTDSGAIEVSTHDKNEVDIEVIRKGSSEDNLEVTFEKNGNTVKVKGDKSGISFISWGSSSALFKVTVPESFDLDLRTSGGSIEVDDLSGDVLAKTSGGSIKLGAIDGEANVKTSGGSIRVNEVSGPINAHTSGGSIKVTISEQPKDDSKLTTSGGSVTAYLKDDVAIDLYASTMGGTVKSEFPVTGTNKRTKIRGEINGGGPDLVLKTSGGSVRIKRL